MTLTTHGVIGAAAMVATTEVFGLTPASLACGFALGFASHLAIDAIPHWDEGHALLRSIREDKANPLNVDMVMGKDFLHDLLILAADALLGLAIATLLFGIWLTHVPFYIVFFGVASGQLPDALQFVYFKLRPKFMRPLQKFHDQIQHEFKNPAFLLIEICLMAAAALVVKLL